MDQLISMIPAEKRHIIAGLREEVRTLLTGEIVRMPTRWKGYRFFPGFEADTAKYAYENYEVEKDSVFMITYPKTGTNWSGEVMRQILFGHDEKLDALTKSLPPVMTLLTMASVDKFKVLDHVSLPRRLFLTHLPEELLNFEKIKKSNGKVIIVLRNPKDQAVSWFHFTQKQNRALDGVREEFSSDWAEFFTYYTQGKQPTFSKDGEWYPDHILGWYRHKNDPNVLFVYYEDMKQDIKREIRRMAKFVDVDLDEERVSKIADTTTFSFMKHQQDSKQDGFSKLRASLNMMRKGQVGEWKEVFTEAQSELIDRLMEEKLGNTDIKFTYEL